MTAVPPAFMYLSDEKILDRSNSVGVANASATCTHDGFAYSDPSQIPTAGSEFSSICLSSHINQEKETPKQTFMDPMGLGPTGELDLSPKFVSFFLPFPVSLQKGGHGAIIRLFYYEMEVTSSNPKYSLSKKRSQGCAHEAPPRPCNTGDSCTRLPFFVYFAYIST